MRLSFSTALALLPLLLASISHASPSQPELPAGGVVAGGVVYLNGDSTDPSAATASSVTNKDAVIRSTTGAAPHLAGSAPLAADPRLAALQVSPDNDLIKFVVGDNGKVIAEIDQDPASLGFGKATRQYIYMGDKVVALTAYRYMSDHVEITRTLVAYQPAGSVAEIKASTSYEKTPTAAR